MDAARAGRDLVAVGVYLGGDPGDGDFTEADGGSGPKAGDGSRNEEDEEERFHEGRELKSWLDLTVATLREGVATGDFPWVNSAADISNAGRGGPTAQGTGEQLGKRVDAAGGYAQTGSVMRRIRPSFLLLLALIDESTLVALRETPRAPTQNQFVAVANASR